MLSFNPYDEILEVARQKMVTKPTVLHIGDAIKYNHDFYDNKFTSRFNVIQATETNREDFIQALKSQK
jgi:hypothetical protein